MNKTILATLAIVTGLALTAAAYTPPTAEQIDAAAADPAAQLAALLQDASINQAAATAAQVAERIAALDLPAEAQAARLAQAIQILFANFPPAQHDGLAGALGEALAGSSAISGAALSSIRAAITGMDGAGDGTGALLLAYDQAFSTGGGTLPPAPNPEPPDSNETPPPPDPEPDDDGAPPAPDPEPDDEEPPPPGPDYPGQTID